MKSMLEISSESQQFPAHDLAQRPILVFAPRMDTLGVSYASHPGMKGDNANLEGGDSLVVSSLGPSPTCVCSTINRLSAGFQCSLDIAGETGDTFHKIDELIG
jgi:hypothetical protein